jgi:mannose-1-phosphate guanylyltransferase/phosphomannomutase
MRQLVVIAGGLGTRLSNSGVRTPKVLLEVKGKTLLERYIELAHEDSYDQLLLILGHQHSEVELFLKGKLFPIDVQIFIELAQLGTGGALIQAKHLLKSEFTLILGDLLVKNANLRGTFDYFLGSGIDVLAFSKYTDHPEDSDLVLISKSNEIEEIQRYPHQIVPEVPISLAGIAHIKRSVLPSLVPDHKIDFFKSMLSEFITNQYSIHCIHHQGLVRDIGTPSRLFNSESYLENTHEFNSQNYALLLDRDGTLIKDIPYNIRTENVELLDHTVSLLGTAITEFDFIGVITNQPLVARGDGDFADVNAINLKMQELIGLDDLTLSFYVCPHHPDSGFQGEVTQLKKWCTCRKPEVELLLQAAIDGRFHLTNALFIGDSDVDVFAAKRVGASWIHLHNEPTPTIESCAFFRLQNGKCLNRNQLEKEVRSWHDHLKSSS